MKLNSFFYPPVKIILERRQKMSLDSDFDEVVEQM